MTAAMAGAIALSDLRTRRVPNALWLGVMTLGGGAAWWAGGLPLLGVHALSAAVVLVVFGLQAERAWIGWGDAKAAGALAASLTPPQLPAFLLAAALGGGGLALTYVLPRAIRRRSRRGGSMVALLAAVRDPVLRRTPVPLAVALALATTAVAALQPAAWWPVMSLLHAGG